MAFSKNKTKVKKGILKLQKSEKLKKSLDIYQTLCNSSSLYNKYCTMEYQQIVDCLEAPLAVLLNASFGLHTGSAAEGTAINLEDYGQHLNSSCYVSDWDTMNVLYHVIVIDEGVSLPHTFYNYMYCLAERGLHTTEGYRKLKILLNPIAYPPWQHAARFLSGVFRKSSEHGYISSKTFVDEIPGKLGVIIPFKHSVVNDGIQGPSNLMKKPGVTGDYVRCLYVKTWPQEAKSWIERQTQWPDKELKKKIEKIGYLLVPTGNSNSSESHLEWRCSFSIAEKILFQSMTKWERYTFLILKAILKEYLPSDINTDGEKQLISTYHMKTLFLWCLEDTKLKWVNQDMLDIIRPILNVLMKWIKKERFPHYFIPKINLLRGRRLHGRKRTLISSILAIRKELSNKIKQSQFYIGQESQPLTLVSANPDVLLFLTFHNVMSYIREILQGKMHTEVFNRISGSGKKFSHSLFIDELVKCMEHDRNSQAEHLYTTMYSDPIHVKLLKEVMPGLIAQYLGCIHLVKYCRAGNKGHILPHVLDTASKLLLKDTLNLDSCSRYLILSILFIAIDDFDKAIDMLKKAEKNFLCMHRKLKASIRRASQHKEFELCLDMDFIREIFQKWTEGQVTSDIVVTWPEYNIVPDLLQFELIHESTQHIIDIPGSAGLCNPGKMVGLGWHLHWSSLSMIRLLKFVCAYNLGSSSASEMENLVADLIASGLSLTVFAVLNDIYTVLNMAAWCYLKIKQYSRAARMIKDVRLVITL